jgi:DNA-binding HxlR family transcriptional regulator
MHGRRQKMKKSKMDSQAWARENPIVPAYPIKACPIATSLGVIGRKWCLLIIRDIAMRKEHRFTEFLRSVQGITRRVLSIRLRELEAEGLIERTVDKRQKPAKITWDLTEKGWDTLPILMSYFGFGSKWYPRSVFRDKKAKELVEIFPQRQLRGSYVNLEV